MSLTNTAPFLAEAFSKRFQFWKKWWCPHPSFCSLKHVSSTLMRTLASAAYFLSFAFKLKWASLICDVFFPLLTATYFFFPKKHMPMLFHSGGLSGTAQAATLYLFMATSKSPWVCIMLPAARMAWEETALMRGSEGKFQVCVSLSLYLIVVGVECEGVSKMFKRFLILSKLSKQTHVTLVIMFHFWTREEKTFPPTCRYSRPRVDRCSVFSGENLNEREKQRAPLYPHGVGNYT